MELLDYVKPELIDINFDGVKGANPSCFVDCTKDDICPGSDDI